MRLVVLTASLKSKEPESKPAAAAPGHATAPAPAPTPGAPGPTTAPPTAPPTAAGHLTLAAGSLTVDVGGSTKVLTLAATGELTADGAIIGKLTADGIAANGTGKRLAAMAPDGTVTIDGERETFTVAPDGTATRGTTALVTIGADGVLAGAAIAEAKPGATLTLGGDPAARRALVFAWLVL